MPDVGDPKVYLVGVAAILDEYPQAVRDALADPRSGTKLLPRFPQMHDIRDACDKAYEPIERAIGRQRAEESHQLGLAAPAKPDQARRDEQADDYETRVKPVIAAAIQAIPFAPVEHRSDGRHFQRIAAELAARKARNSATQSTYPPNQNPPP